MAEFNNEQDKKVWAVLTAFDFNKHKTIVSMRKELFVKLIESLGYCCGCSWYDKENSFCKVMSTKVGVYDRCAEFEMPEKEEGDPFDIMMKPFKDRELLLEEATKIYKYQKWSRASKFPAPKQEVVKEKEEES